MHPGFVRTFLTPLALALLLAASLPGATALTLAPTWTQTIDLGALDLGQDVAMDAAGNVIVTGTSQAAGGNDMVTVKLSKTGETLWTQRFHEGDDDRSEGVVADVDGSIYVAGTVKTPLGDDAIIRKYDASGNHVWTSRLDKGTSESVRSISLAPGHVFIAGTSLSVNGGDGFVAKFTTGGQEVWARPINLYYLDEAFDVAVDRDGSSVVVGRVARDDSFDAMLRKYDADGNAVWTQFINGTGRDELRGVAIDKENRIWTVGTTAPDNTTADVLVAAFAADGTMLWKNAIDLAGDADEGRDIAIDASGNALITGFGVTSGSKNGFVLKIGEEGNEIGWRHENLVDGIDGLGGIEVMPSGLVAVAGARQAGGADFDYFVSVFDQGSVTANFAAPATATSSAQLAFTDESRSSIGTLNSWRWDFGDGTTATTQHPTHSFEWGGSYTVSLTVADEYGNRATSTRALSVDGPARPGDTAPTTTPPTTSPPGTEVEESTGGGIGAGLIALIGIGTLAAAGAAYFLMRRKP